MNTFELKNNGISYSVYNDVLTLSRKGVILASFCLSPVVDNVVYRIAEWKQLSENNFGAEASSDISIHFGIENSRPCLWMETQRPFLESIAYLSEGVINGESWHSFIPDEWDRDWDCQLDIEVAASSNYLGMNVDFEDGAGMTDPGDKPPTWIFNIPAHMCAFKGDSGEWLGISMPLPHAVGAVRYKMNKEKFSLVFEAVQASCTESGCPKVYFESGLNEPYDLCDRHYQLSKELGLTKKQIKAHPEWWAHPYYKSYDDQVRMENKEGGYEGHIKIVDGKPHSALTLKRFKKWHKLVQEKTGLRGKVNAFFDQVYFNCYGDYRRINDEMGGIEGFRKLIDQWRSHGIRCGLYFHPYTCSKDAGFYKNNPEACLAANSLGADYNHGVRVGSSGSVYFDWTHPATREYLLDTIEFLLSDKPGCLNADWLAINNTIGPDPRYYKFHDPEWGTGDLMQLKVQKLIYEKAKSIKPDCLVRRQSALAPYMEPYYDEAQLCEEWNGATAAWWKRGQIAVKLIKNNIAGFDPWFVTLTKGCEYYMGMAVCFVPATEASTHAIHPYLSYRELQEKDYRRRKAGMLTYMNAPMKTSDIKHIELSPEGKFISAWRKRAEGPLAGFYASLALSPRGLVTYNENCALVAASESRTAEIPLPPGAELESVERILHNGKAVPIEFAKAGTKTIRIHVADAAGDTLYTKISYKL